MGIVPSRPSPYSIPGALSSSTDSVSDDGCNDASGVATDVITLSEHPLTHDKLAAANSSKSKSPGLISFQPFVLGSDLTPSPQSTDSSSVVTPAASFISNPSMADVQLQLHSPNTQIVGTPFATSNTPFEYPFPSDTSSNGSMSHFPSPASSSLSVAPPSPSHILPSNDGSSFALHPPHADFPVGILGAGQITLTHPKMRSTPPPIPPSLLKKQQDRARRFTVDISTAGYNAHGVHHAASDLHGRRQDVKI